MSLPPSTVATKYQDLVYRVACGTPYAKSKVGVHVTSFASKRQGALGHLSMHSKFYLKFPMLTVSVSGDPSSQRITSERLTQTDSAKQTLYALKKLDI